MQPSLRRWSVALLAAAAGIGGCYEQHGVDDSSGRDAGMLRDIDGGHRAADAAAPGAPDAGRDAATDDASGRDVGIDAPMDAGIDAAACPEGTVSSPEGCTASTPTAPCDVPGNVLHLEGESWVFRGAGTFGAPAEFSVTASAAPLWMHLPTPNTVEARVEVSSRESYRLDVSAAGTPRALEVGVYEDATRFSFSIARATPGLSLVSAGRGCNQVSGRFEVHRLSLEGEVVREVLVSFDHYCEGRDLVRGCLHYAAP